MKKNLLIILALACGAMFTATAATESHKYVGAGQCKMCHQSDKKGNQYGVWEKSKHAEAYKTLEGDKAKAIAKEKGLKKAPAESPECLACHVGASADAALLDKKFDMKQGVQCESCHGAGSDFKAMPVMKDKAKALAAGLVDAGKMGKELCEKCHIDKNQHGAKMAAFKYDEMWAKVKHPYPVK
ncbi:MAG: cytochrome c family protein [Ignavibacteriales bacterium]|nr:cytochrome c family protein [Ignavibacteriales bacterium]